MSVPLIGVGSVILAVDSRSRIFGLDDNMLGQAGLVILSALVLFTLLSYLLFNPVKEVLRKRTERIKQDITHAADIKKEAESLQSEYKSRIDKIDKEAEVLLSTARKKALTNQKEIILEAEIEAERIIERAKLEIKREKEKIKDDIRKEMIEVATIMASKFVVSSIDEKTKEGLIEETLLGLGEDTWLN